MAQINLSFGLRAQNSKNQIFKVDKEIFQEKQESRIEAMSK